MIGAAAAAVALGMVSLDANALALGQINVQSAIGEPLRAEIDVTDITAAEADGLRVTIGSASAYSAAGVAYNAALNDVRATLQRRADGRYVVRLTGTRSLSDPFVDLLLEANWGAGRIVRDYTLLLDPPASRSSTATAIAPTPPQLTPLPGRRPLPSDGSQASLRRQRTAPVTPAEAPAPRAAAAGGGAAGAGGSDRQLTVQNGDTAYRIASANKPAGISLDQMLVALLRTNPNAFVDGNMNRMRSGAVLDLPNAAQAGATPAEEARRTVVAQSRDFGGYRRRLAENAPTTRVAGADRQSSGRLQANVEDRNAAAPSADRLTIAQGGSARAAETKLAQERQGRQSDTRVAELQKNITDLNTLMAASGAKGAPAAGASAPVGQAPVTPVPASPAAGGSPAAPATTTTTTPAPSAAATAPGATTPAATAPGASAPISLPAGAPPAAPAATAAVTTTPSAPLPTASAALPAGPIGLASGPTGAASAAAPAASAAATPPKAAAPVKPAPAAERGLFDSLLDNPILIAAFALIVALIGFLLYRVFGRKKRKDAGDSVFLESRLPKDSFFGATGGASVDTKNTGTSGSSSLSYSPSQLDAGDVDPVAEADVYLAYGRDLQAEEILREALRANPNRTAIHLKLLEIHAKRRDLRAYEALAGDVQKLTGGTGNEWNRVVDMGRELDPGNPLYANGMRSAADGTRPLAAGLVAGVAGAAAVAAMTPPPAPAAVAAVPPPPAFVPSVTPLDFDLDLDDVPLATAPTAPAPLTATLPPSAGRAAAPADTERMPDIEPMMDFDNDFDTAPGSLEAMSPRPAPSSTAATAPAPLRPQNDSGFIDFDMTALSGLAKPKTSEADTDTERGALDSDDEGTESPHAIKLSLARELQALGDTDGARALAEEVETESTGDLKAEAQLLLSQLR